MSNEYKKERSLLKFSTFSCLGFAFLGIGTGLWNGSLVIIFDGAYSLISLALTLIALFASIYIHPKEKSKQKKLSAEKIQFIESIVVLFKGLVVTLLCLVSLYSAVSAIFSGGREVNTVSALIFGIINVAGCLATYLALSKKSGKKSSIILKAESSQWLMDTVISGAVLIGFVVAAALIATGLSEYAVYADPMMVVIASVYFISVPLKMMKDSFKAIVNLARKANKNNTSLIKTIMI